MTEAKGVHEMRLVKGRAHRLRAAVVGVAVAATGLFVGHGAGAVDSSFTQTCGTGSGELNIQSVNVSNTATDVIYGVTMCSAFTPANVSRIVWQFSFAGSEASAPVDNCMTVEPSAYTGASHTTVGFLAYVTERCVGATNGLPGSPDASSDGLIGTAPVTQTGNSLSIDLKVATLRAAGLGGANSYGFRVITRDTDSAPHLNSNTPQDAAPEGATDFLTHSLATQSLTLPTLSIAKAVKVLRRGATVMHLPVTLSIASGRTVTVHYQTTDGTAHQPTDYTTATGTLTFPAGTTTQNVDVTVKHGKKGARSFTVTLDSPVNAAIGTGTATGTIRSL